METHKQNFQTKMTLFMIHAKSKTKHQCNEPQGAARKKQNQEAHDGYRAKRAAEKLLPHAARQARTRDQFIELLIYTG